MSDSGKTLIIIPAFNEAQNIGRVIEQVKQLNLEIDIGVVDDGSGDKTVEIARSKGVRVLCLPFNLGYGAALQTGYKYALESGYDYVIQMDGDGQHEPESIRTLLAEIQKDEVDLVIGSRFLKYPGNGTYKIPPLRRFGINIFSLIASSCIGQKITDPTSGFQALNRNLFDFYASEVYPVDYPDADVLIMLSRAGFKLKEVPVLMRKNLQDKSMHSGLKPIYYLFKMFLSIIVTLLRKDLIEREKHAS